MKKFLVEAKEFLGPYIAEIQIKFSKIIWSSCFVLLSPYRHLTSINPWWQWHNFE